MTIEDPELAVSNLTLSLIDTPGFEDTDGKIQVSNEIYIFGVRVKKLDLLMTK